jgi:adenine-specific DNA-methyltransferase
VSTKMDALLHRIDDAALRAAVKAEFAEVTDGRKVGLVFEHHIPETVTLRQVVPRRGLKVRLRANASDAPRMTVVRVRDGQAACVPARPIEEAADGDSGAVVTVAVEDLAVVAEFGDPIYPGLREVGRVSGPGANPDAAAHVVLNAENHHALQALQFSHHGKFDAILIDPPYNTGEETWVYSDRFIDRKDIFTHSKWLSFMHRRLDLARTLLANNGIMAVHINEHEVNNLGVLLRQMFPNARINMVTVRVASSGQPRQGLGRVDEQVFLLYFGEALPSAIPSLVGEKVKKPMIWDSLSGVGKQNCRPQRSPSMVYPVYIDVETTAIVGTGLNLTERFENGLVGEVSNTFSRPAEDEAPDGAVSVWPVSDTGEMFGWRLRAQTLMEQWPLGHVAVGPARDPSPGRQFSLKYLTSGNIKKIETGAIRGCFARNRGSADTSVEVCRRWEVSPRNDVVHWGPLHDRRWGLPHLAVRLQTVQLPEVAVPGVRHPLGDRRRQARRPRPRLLRRFRHHAARLGHAQRCRRWPPDVGHGDEQPGRSKDR